MRLWTLHPRYLDPQGLVALWREALLAQRVLAGGTRGYRSHPQLERFRAAPDPAGAIAAFLHGVGDEAARRGYAFDRSRIVAAGSVVPLTATSGQLAFELAHLRAKLAARRPQLLAVLPAAAAAPEPHPLFRVVPGPRADWERG
jgi:hypothetical protein